MADKKKIRPIGIDDLWKLERLGAPSLSPDGAQAVASVTSYSMADNKAGSSLWLYSTLGGRPRRLTACGEKDGAPQWSPTGTSIAFVARREQQGAKDKQAQLYVIAPDGGEAWRAADVATGVEAFRWHPGGRSLLFVSWVWPDLKGAKAQAKAQKAFDERKETAYVTSEATYRHWDHHLPMGRVPHLHLLTLGAPGEAGAVRDLFEGTAWELERREPGPNSFDVSPDGKYVAFAFDPAEEKRPDGRLAIAEMELKTRRVRIVAQDADWHFDAPRYSPDGQRLAFGATHQGLKHTMPLQLAVVARKGGGWGAWEVVSAEWDHAVHAPLHWEDDGSAVLFLAEDKARTHLWRFDLADRRAEVVVAGGWVSGFDKAAGTLVTLADSAMHPARLHAHVPGLAPRRIESVNDTLMSGLALGAVEERWIAGAQGDKVQMWLVYPPGFDAAKASKGKQRWPILHTIHGGPHTCPGDNWHYRWNTQLFAAQGYVVANVNYHGSSGFGHAFLDSITHRWGELELQDIEAGTEALLKEPWADAQRVFATGGSYGGYMVMWMNGHLPAGRYRAYVCHAGCWDWVGMFADDAWAWHAKELGSWYWNDMARVHRQSPHAHAAGLSTPTLVIHGALDYRVPDAQGLAYYNTLKAQGVPSRLVWFPDENHWILKPRNSRLWHAEFFDWLRRHDPALKNRR
jgi:dipeptidyl aminopeptidase/acylaminoacyl peptidase